MLTSDLGAQLYNHVQPRADDCRFAVCAAVRCALLSLCSTHAVLYTPSVLLFAPLSLCSLSALSACHALMSDAVHNAVHNAGHLHT